MILSLLTGCYSSEDRKLEKQYKKQAGINAINYVKEKYGFNAKVKSVDVNKQCTGLFPIPDDCWPDGRTVTVKLKANKKIFFVYIPGNEESVDGRDDYQMDVIEKDLIDYFKKNISIELYDYNLDLLFGIKEYYNNNLDFIIPYINELELYYIGENNLNELNLDKIEKFLQIYKKKLSLINFKTKEKCKEYKNVKMDDENWSDAETSIYKTNSLLFYNGEKTFKKYDNISNYNDEVYIYSADNIYTITPSNLGDMSNYRKLYSDLENKKIKQLNAYSIPYTSSYLYIYFPINKVTKFGYKFFAFECYVNGEKKYYLHSHYSNDAIRSIGNYYIEARDFMCDVNSEITFGLLRIG